MGKIRSSATIPESTMGIDKLVRSGRKTIGLQITSDAALIVRAPRSARLSDIEKAVTGHRSWIQKKQDEARRWLQNFHPKRFIDGEEFLFLGNSHGLFIRSQQVSPLIFENGFYIAERCAPEAKQIMIDWYVKNAQETIPPRVSFYGQKGRMHYNRIRISNAKRRWGSCSRNGDLNFSWRLVMAPVEVIDYVVVHELAHLKVKNHSSCFWTVVESMMPDYKIHRKWLRDNERLFAFE